MTKMSAEEKAMIEAFRAKQAKEKTETKAEKKPFTPPTREQLLTKHKGKELAECSVTDGSRKFVAGTKVECHAIWFNRRFFQETARITQIGGEPIRDEDGKDIGYINPKFLKAGKELSPARKAAIEAARGSSETILLHATVVREVPGKSAMLNYSGWAGPKWFGMTTIEKVRDLKDGSGLFEVEEWALKRQIGADATEALKAQHDAFEALK